MDPTNNTPRIQGLATYLGSIRQSGRQQVFSLVPKYKGSSYVMVSVAIDGPKETVIFASNYVGSVLCDSGLAHCRGIEDHAHALDQIGYTIAGEEDDYGL